MAEAKNTASELPPTVGATAAPPTVAAVAQQQAVAATVAEPVATILSLRDGNGHLTRAGMEHAIRSGGSAMHNGIVHTSLDTLPSAAELAKGDPERERVAREDLLRMRATLDAELAKLDGKPKK